MVPADIVFPVLVHLNGQLVPAERAAVSAFDRGFLFGDGVYEGIRAFGARIFAGLLHVQRMRAGLAETRIEGFDPAALLPLSLELLRANGLHDASIYWQVTRGAPRDVTDAGALRNRIPGRSSGYAPTVFGYGAPMPPVSAYLEPKAKRVAVRPDTRWLRGHVKSISQMGGVLAAYEADEDGAEDAILLRDGLVTEGIATNVFVSIGGEIVTPPEGGGLILPGVTRRILLDADPTIRVGEVTERDLRRADEVMLAGTFTMVAAATTLDGLPVGDGRVGPAARRLLKTLTGAVERELEGSAPVARRA